MPKGIPENAVSAVWDERVKLDTERMATLFGVDWYIAGGYVSEKYVVITPQKCMVFTPIEFSIFILGISAGLAIYR